MGRELGTYALNLISNTVANLPANLRTYAEFWAWLLGDDWELDATPQLPEGVLEFTTRSQDIAYIREGLVYNDATYTQPVAIERIRNKRNPNIVYLIFESSRRTFPTTSSSSATALTTTRPSGYIVFITYCVDDRRTLDVKDTATFVTNGTNVGTLQNTRAISHTGTYLADAVSRDLLYCKLTNEDAGGSSLTMVKQSFTTDGGQPGNKPVKDITMYTGKANPLLADIPSLDCMYGSIGDLPSRTSVDFYESLGLSVALIPPLGREPIDISTVAIEGLMNETSRAASQIYFPVESVLAPFIDRVNSHYIINGRYTMKSRVSEFPADIIKLNNMQEFAITRSDASLYHWLFMI